MPNRSRVDRNDQRRVLLVSCFWQTKNKMGNRLYYWSRLVQTHDHLTERLLSNANRGSNASESVCLDPFCALIGWQSFDRWKRMKVRHVLRRSAVFKPNNCNWHYLQLYFKIIFIYNFCNGKVSWQWIAVLFAILTTVSKLFGCTNLFKIIYTHIAWYAKVIIVVIVYVHGEMTITVLLVHDCV